MNKTAPVYRQSEWLKQISYVLNSNWALSIRTSNLLLYYWSFTPLFNSFFCFLEPLPIEILLNIIEQPSDLSIYNFPNSKHMHFSHSLFTSFHHYGIFAIPSLHQFFQVFFVYTFANLIINFSKNWIFRWKLIWWKKKSSSWTANYVLSKGIYGNKFFYIFFSSN